MKREERIKLIAQAFNGLTYREFKESVGIIEQAFYPPRRKELTSENISSGFEECIGLFKDHH